MTKLEEHIKKYLEKEIEAAWVDVYHREMGEVSVYVGVKEACLYASNSLSRSERHLSTYYSLKIRWIFIPANSKVYFAPQDDPSGGY